MGTLYAPDPHQRRQVEGHGRLRHPEAGIARVLGIAQLVGSFATPEDATLDRRRRLLSEG